ncbi:Flp pilus assembly protein TadB [Phocoenobacter uteri]|uniref:Flp pilus assembly protein TadB n=1 Tax=Phocoenobacter uteri TaxID=146806 RepID=A0A379C980_9PAST|nr:type II secretion system F family protein [Phocoenobacter uteri]MDG6882636.1 pilus assembly protein TadC [Phocoenobacter uteri]SUB58801.1 Flp pilus assembly protein TadB [Phocoenobacter uteri]
MTRLSFFIALICCGVFIFIFAILGRNKLQRNKKILAGTHHKEKVTEEPKSGKNKQQMDLELLLISNNRFLKLLGEIDKNIKIKLLITAVLFAIYAVATRGGTPDKIQQAFVFFGILVVTIVVPGIFTGIIIKRKIKSIMVDLPGFIDLVAVCVQTGMTIDMALKQIATDFKTLNPDLTYVMLRIIRKAELTSLSSALDDLAISLPTREIRMFTTVLQQSLNFGSSIYGQLIQLSADIRELQLLAIEERLGTLAAKMSIPLIAFIMFPIVILILAPGAMRVFPHVF